MPRWIVTTALLGALLCALAAAAGWWYLRGLEDVVVEKFSGSRWSFPSRVYSDTFLIYPGLDVESAGLFDRLARLNYREVTAPPLRKGDFRRIERGLQIYLRNFAYADQSAPERLVEMRLAGRIVGAIADANTGEQLDSFLIEPEVITGLYEENWEERREVSLAEVPPRLVHAVLVTEDQRFFEHHGIDGLGILRAALVNLRHARIVQGGSTLTQQLMKNFFLTEERTWQRKVREAAMAVVAERLYGKNEILENYLNEIYLGQNGLQGIFGVWEASQFYFARRPSELSLGETATLAGLIRAPNGYSPYRDAERARQRRDTVLHLMLEHAIITRSECDAALAEPIRSTAMRGGRNAAPYFVDFLRDELATSYPAQALTSEGLGIFTALDLQMQDAAVRAVTEGVAELENRYPKLRERGAPVQACLVALQPQTGEIKAMVGGRDYGATQFNRVAQARRQPGSVFKPIVFLAAFEATAASDDPLLPTTQLIDEPFEWAYDSQVWRPANYRGQYMGRVTARRALELSLNSATARLAQQIGLEPIRDLARRMGITSELPSYPSMVLGSLEVSPLEVAQAFAVLANQGLRAALRATKKVVDRDGQPIERRPLEVERVTSPEAAYLVTHLMEGVLDRGTGRGARELGFARPAAGKTGTTNDSKDAWFVGFTPELLTVVWVGFDERQDLGLTGASAALPIWTSFMKRAAGGRPPTEFLPPPGIALARIDPLTGGLATPGCAETIDEAFWEGHEPTAPCPLHSAYDPVPLPDRAGAEHPAPPP